MQWKQITDNNNRLQDNIQNWIRTVTYADCRQIINIKDAYDQIKDLQFQLLDGYMLACEIV